MSKMIDFIFTARVRGGSFWYFCETYGHLPINAWNVEHHLNWKHLIICWFTLNWFWIWIKFKFMVRRFSQSSIDFQHAIALRSYRTFDKTVSANLIKRQSTLNSMSWHRLIFSLCVFLSWHIYALNKIIRFSNNIIRIHYFKISSKSKCQHMLFVQ